MACRPRRALRTPLRRHEPGIPEHRPRSRRRSGPICCGEPAGALEVYTHLLDPALDRYVQRSERRGPNDPIDIETVPVLERTNGRVEEIVEDRGSVAGRNIAVESQTPPQHRHSRIGHPELEARTCGHHRPTALALDLAQAGGAATMPV